MLALGDLYVVTERPEAVEAGTVMLVGTDKARIVDGVESVLLDEALYAQMARAHNPYGDGHAAERIARILKDWEAGKATGGDDMLADIPAAKKSVG